MEALSAVRRRDDGGARLAPHLDDTVDGLGGEVRSVGQDDDGRADR